MAIGSDGVQLLGGHGYTKEHPVERWYRDLRAAGVMEGALCRWRSTSRPPRSSSSLVSQAHQVATEIFRPNSRKYDVDEHSYPKELDMLAAVIDGMNEGGALSGAGAGGVGESNGSKAGRDGQSQRQQHGQPARLGRAVLGRRRAAADDAAPGPRPGRDRRGRQRGAAQAVRRQVGRDGDHRARGRVGLSRDPHDRDARREDRRVRAERREDLRHRRRPRRADRGLGHARPQAGTRGDQVVRGRARQPGTDPRAARAQAWNPGVRHRRLPPRGLPHPQGQPARQPRDRTQARIRRA